MSFPVPSKRFVIKSSDNILPLFIPLEHVFGRLSDATLNIAMLENSPHILNSIYIENSMST